ncbi:MAG: hypothetical protein WC569_02690 [Candidatus Omnitrophota bacterium]
MGKILVFFCLICAFCTPAVFSEEIEINSEVMSVNLDDEYCVIKGGEDAGIEIGDGLIVHRDHEKIAEAQVIEVKSNVSAAEILTLEKDRRIMEGDAVLIVKVAVETGEAAEKPKKSKWTRIGAGLAKPAESLSGAMEPIAAGTAPIYETTREGDTIKISIKNQPGPIFSYALRVLSENGYSVTLTNRATGMISATKPIALSLLGELWADAAAAIDHKVVASLDIKNEGDTSILTASAFKEHSKKWKQIKNPVTVDSRHYNELVSIVSKIKELSED